MYMAVLLRKQVFRFLSPGCLSSRCTFPQVCVNGLWVSPWPGCCPPTLTPSPRSFSPPLPRSLSRSFFPLSQSFSRCLRLCLCVCLSVCLFLSISLPPFVPLLFASICLYLSVSVDLTIRLSLTCDLIFEGKCAYHWSTFGPMAMYASDFRAAGGIADANSGRWGYEDTAFVHKVRCVFWLERRRLVDHDTYLLSIIPTRRGCNTLWARGGGEGDRGCISECGWNLKLKSGALPRSRAPPCGGARNKGF